MSRPLEGRRALVTGAGTGIGQGIARELALQGASVAIHYAHSGEGARDICIEITSAGGRAMVLRGDLSRVADCRRRHQNGREAQGYDCRRRTSNRAANRSGRWARSAPREGPVRHRFGTLATRSDGRNRLPKP